ncbi:soluble lytic murein transglycosylase-like protein [Pseudoxanthomonas broegbernensis]|nr:soluble lytic murein transglycosylase-like protein [Pseudoxanthomonas broegbernensis]
MARPGASAAATFLFADNGLASAREAGKLRAMKGMPGILGLVLFALVAAPAGAGTLYRCVGPDGATSYVNTRIAGAQCAVFSRYVPDRSPARPAPPPPPPPAVASVGGADAAPASLRVSHAPLPPGPHRSNAGSAPQRRVAGQVYSYMQDGVRHFSSRPPARGAAAEQVRTIAYSFIETCYACALQPGVSFATVRLNTNAYQGEIAAAAREFGVDEAIVRAVIHAESAFNPTALSRVGAQGLMQLMPATARRFGVADSYDAGQNIRGGVQYLAWLLKRFNGDLTLAAPATTPARARSTATRACRPTARPSATCSAWPCWPSATAGCRPRVEAGKRRRGDAWGVRKTGRTGAGGGVRHCRPVKRSVTLRCLLRPACLSWQVRVAGSQRYQQKIFGVPDGQ